MKSKRDEKRPLREIAREFFEYLGRQLPQECASDEFYFLPRSETALDHLSYLDDLSPEKIEAHVGYVQGLLSEIESQRFEDLEDEIDRLFLKQGMESFVREFGNMAVWRNDPTLYIKIPLFATDQIVSATGLGPQEIEVELSDLFAQIPPFLQVGEENLHGISEIARQVALDMTTDAIHFYNRDIGVFVKEKIAGGKVLISQNQEVLKAWERYRNRLLQLPSKKHFGVGRDCLQERRKACEKQA